jgi:PAS domain-containing protein
MAEHDVTRRWTRVFDGLRTRRLKVRRAEAVAAAALDEILVESLETGDRMLQELAGTHLEMQQLRRGLYAETLNRQHLFDQMPVACLSTDDSGVIQNANQLAAEFFNVSAKHLRGRLLLHFAADRDAFALLLRALPIDGSRVQAVMRIRPRERSLSKLNALIVPERTLETSSWLWFMTLVAGESSTEPYPEQKLA